MKRKCQSLSNTTSSNSDDSRQNEGTSPPRLQQLFGAWYFLKDAGSVRWAPCHSTNYSRIRSACVRECVCVRVCSWAPPDMLKDQSGVLPLDVPEKKPSDAAPAVVGTSLPHPVPRKPGSVFSLTSQCSYSSTIVHVGDRKPQLDSGTVVCGGCACVCVGGGSIYCMW